MDAGQSKEPAECTCLRLRKAARKVTRVYDRHLEPFGLTVTQYSLLGHVHALEGIGMGALAETLVTDPTTLTRNLRPLERRGLVAVEPDPADRRARSLRLTPEGRAVLRRARPGWQRAQRKVQAVLGDDAASLDRAIEHVLSALR